MAKDQASTHAQETVTKGAFAEMLGVSAGRVSQYIAEGKLTGALVGEGRRARIDVAKGMAALNDSLDPSQRLGNGLGTRIVVPDDMPSDPPSDAPLAPAVFKVEDQLKQEKLLAAQRANRRAAEEDALRAGQLVMADVARKEMETLATRMMQTFEGSLTDMAAAVSAQFKLPHRDVVHCMRLAFAEVRTRASADAANKSEEAPAVVETIMQEDAVLQ